MGIVRGRWKKTRPKKIISSEAVRAFLDRDLADYTFLKDVPKDELLQDAHDKGMRFATECWHNQLVCWTLGSELASFYFLLKQGGGKSKISLDIIRYRLRAGHIKRSLILAPEMIHIASWEDQIRTHAPDLTYQLLLGDKRQRERSVLAPADIYLMNHKGLEVYMAHRVKTKKGTKLAVDPYKASEFAARFQLVIWDEFHRLVDEDSLHYRMSQWLSVSAEFRYGLSGTPHGHDPSPLWPQFRLLDHGETLGVSPTLWREAFFNSTESKWGRGYDYKFKKPMATTLNRVIRNRSITYTTEELYDLPRCVQIRIPVTLEDEGRMYYDRILAKLKDKSGDYESLGSVYIRMRQCASGFLALKADDESRIEVEFQTNPKIEALRAFLRERIGEKILVYHHFIHSGEMIEAMLIEEKIGHTSIRGGTKDIAGRYNKFLSDPKCNILVLNTRTGSESINPQYVCRRTVFFESPDDPKQREQAERRTYRPGQKHVTFIHDLVVKGTVEVRILKSIKEGLSFLSSVLSGKADITSLED